MLVKSVNHFIMFVADLKKKAIFYLDNRITDDDIGHGDYEIRIGKIGCLISKCLKEFFIKFLGAGFPIEEFAVPEVRGDWKQGAYDLDCGCYVLTHMLLFDGSVEFNCEYLNNVSYTYFIMLFCYNIMYLFRILLCFDYVTFFFVACC